ncbi:MAG: Uncharacterized protein FD161_4486 [Limisphaerales bacterium]|nr:MAG: Uncharacterized protein FD161_4486 [Limisphaerales bacterium]TXT46439.1 MAG: Uncharacterized protein FD140_4450 [Limisphaerales bacterium]
MLTNELLAQGTIIREPVGNDKGYWVGCPGAFYDETERAWYLTYRIRRPRGVAPDRGGEVRIARSADLKQWDDVLRITKDQYNSASIERSALHRGRDGVWRYFTSYVDPADGRWCTALMKAAKVEQLDPSQRQVIFTAAPLGLEGVKDPWLLEVDGVYHLFLSIALPTVRTSAASHGTLDIFNTGECVSATGLATSRDLDNWEWQGVVLKPEATGWDKYCRRINSVARVGDRWLAFYDGSASEAENYEERCALAVSTNLRDWRSVSPNGPFVTSPFASGSARYFDAKFANGQWHLFYEFARKDGAHDMRVVPCSEAALGSLLA